MNEKNTAIAAKKNIIEIFMGGCKKGFYIGVEMILPAMILGYAIVQFLKLTTREIGRASCRERV